MLEQGIVNKLNLIEPNLYSYSGSEVTLVETQSGGEAKLKCRLSNSYIAFFHMTSNKPNYFKCKKCADYIIFEKANETGWKLHVIELKKKIKLKEWEEIKEQFKGAILNAKALSGVLGIKINSIKCYTAFREDCLHVTQTPELVGLKVPIGLDASKNPHIEWEFGKVHIDLDSKLVLEHQKVRLDIETGQAELAI